LADDSGVGLGVHAEGGQVTAIRVAVVASVPSGSQVVGVAGQQDGRLKFTGVHLVVAGAGDAGCGAGWLQPELPSDRNALVFASHRGGYLPIEEYRRAFDKACDAVGITGLVPHGLRHTAASLAIRAGANVKVVQRLLGHATAAMALDCYGHLLSDDLAGVADALGKAIESTAVSLRYSGSEYGEAETISAVS
jgi:hypothetical protein